MNGLKALAKFYQIEKRRFGVVEAKEALASAMYLVICDIQEAGLEVTEEELEKRLLEYAQDFIEVDKNTKAA